LQSLCHFFHFCHFHIGVRYRGISPVIELFAYCDLEAVAPVPLDFYLLAIGARSWRGTTTSTLASYGIQRVTVGSITDSTNIFRKTGNAIVDRAPHTEISSGVKKCLIRADPGFQVKNCEANSVNNNIIPSTTKTMSWKHLDTLDSSLSVEIPIEIDRASCPRSRQICETHNKIILELKWYSLESAGYICPINSFINQHV
jgi:hypothetical protein